MPCVASFVFLPFYSSCSVQFHSFASISLKRPNAETKRDMLNNLCTRSSYWNYSFWSNVTNCSVLWLGCESRIQRDENDNDDDNNNKPNGGVEQRQRSKWRNCVLNIFISVSLVANANQDETVSTFSRAHFTKQVSRLPIFHLVSQASNRCSHDQVCFCVNFLGNIVFIFQMFCILFPSIVYDFVDFVYQTSDNLLKQTNKYRCVISRSRTHNGHPYIY